MQKFRIPLRHLNQRDSELLHRKARARVTKTLTFIPYAHLISYLLLPSSPLAVVFAHELPFDGPEAHFA